MLNLFYFFVSVGLSVEEENPLQTRLLSNHFVLNPTPPLTPISSSFVQKTKLIHSINRVALVLFVPLLSRGVLIRPFSYRNSKFCCFKTWTKDWLSLSLSPNFFHLNFISSFYCLFVNWFDFEKKILLKIKQFRYFNWKKKHFDGSFTWKIFSNIFEKSFKTFFVSQFSGIKQQCAEYIQNIYKIYNWDNLFFNEKILPAYFSPGKKTHLNNKVCLLFGWHWGFLCLNICLSTRVFQVNLFWTNQTSWILAIGWTNWGKQPIDVFSRTPHLIIGV